MRRVTRYIGEEAALDEVDGRAVEGSVGDETFTIHYVCGGEDAAIKVGGERRFVVRGRVLEGTRDRLVVLRVDRTQRPLGSIAGACLGGVAGLALGGLTLSSAIVAVSALAGVGAGLVLSRLGAVPGIFVRGVENQLARILLGEPE